MLANALASLQFDYIARLLAQVATDVVVIVNLAKETDALRVLALGVNQVLALGYHTHLILHVVAYWEQRLLKLPVGYLCQEIGLVLHWVRTGAEPFITILVGFCHSVVASGYQVVVVTTFFVERAKLYQSVAHHVRVGCKSCAHFVHGVACHLVPILLVAVYHLQLAAVLVGHGSSHLEVLL